MLAQLIKLIKSGIFRDILLSGFRLFKKHGILQEGQHKLAVTVIVKGESDVQAQTTIDVNYFQSRLLKYPQIQDIASAEDWTVSGI